VGGAECELVGEFYWEISHGVVSIREPIGRNLEEVELHYKAHVVLRNGTRELFFGDGKDQSPYVRAPR
jgi:hypothetical protein